MNFLKEKLDNFEVFKDLCQSIQEEKKSVIVNIKSEHDKKFENEKFSKFCASEGISYEFSISSQQKGIVEKKTRAIQESSRVRLHGKNLSYHFWVEAMNTACYIYNRVTLR